MSPLLEVKPIYPADKFSFNQYQTEWLADLESGNFKQGENLLRSLDDHYCCLGIASEKWGGPAIKNEECYEYSGCKSYISMMVSQMLQLSGDGSGSFRQPFSIPMPWHETKSSGTFKSLVSLNDCTLIDAEGKAGHVFGFKDIAAYIRHDPFNVFIEAGLPE